MEQKRFEKQSPQNDYVMSLIRLNKKYMVFRQEYNGKVFYKVQVTKKNFDGTTTKGYLPISFKRGVNLLDKTIIVVKKTIENFYIKDHDLMVFYNIIEFEIQENEEQSKNQALESFKDNLATRDDDTYSKFENTMEIDDSELPF